LAAVSVVKGEESVSHRYWSGDGLENRFVRVGAALWLGVFAVPLLLPALVLVAALCPADGPRPWPVAAGLLAWALAIVVPFPPTALALLGWAKIAARADRRRVAWRVLSILLGVLAGALSPFAFWLAVHLLLAFTGGTLSLALAWTFVLLWAPVLGAFCGMYLGYMSYTLALRLRAVRSSSRLLH
jgi:hypothetical protein